MRILIAAVTFSAILVTPALAEPKKAKPAPAPTKTLTIESEEVEGGIPRPGESTLAIRQFGHSASLIQLRKDFIAEIVKTAEDL